MRWVQRKPDSKDAVLTLGVASLAEAVEKVRQAGGKVLDAGHLVPGVGNLASVEDTEGNLFGLMEFLPGQPG